MSGFSYRYACACGLLFRRRYEREDHEATCAVAPQPSGDPDDLEEWTEPDRWAVGDRQPATPTLGLFAGGDA